MSLDYALGLVPTLPEPVGPVANANSNRPTAKRSGEDLLWSCARRSTFRATTTRIDPRGLLSLFAFSYPSGTPTTAAVSNLRI